MSTPVGEALTASFTYIENGEPVVSDEIATATCNQGSTKVCVADIHLLGSSFSTENLGKLTISGNVELNFDIASDARRRLYYVPLTIQNPEQKRYLANSVKDQGSRRVIDDSGEFNLIIILAGEENSKENGEESGGFMSQGKLVSTVAVMTTSVLFF